MPDFSLEKTHLNKYVAGVDEAGRGPWVGPVIAAAVIFKTYENIAYIDQINDSKKLSEKKREEIFEYLVNDENVVYAIGESSSDKIDKLNILVATKLAMKKAIDLLEIKPDHVLIDGNQSLKDINIDNNYVIKGDSVSTSIAAASIIAKVTRDRIMCNLAAEYPEYGWESNKGYGTKSHMEALQKNGVTIFHRKSFRPVRELLEKAS